MGQAAAATAAAPKINTLKLSALLAKLGELQEKQAAIVEEVNELLGGGQGIGHAMKELEIAFDAIWCARYAPGQMGRYVWSYTKDKPQMKRLLRLLGLEEVRRRVVTYLKTDDPFFTRARHSFGLFVQSINQHADESSHCDDFRLDAAAPTDCRHRPPCTSDQQHTQAKLREMRS